MGSRINVAVATLKSILVILLVVVFSPVILSGAIVGLFILFFFAGKAFAENLFEMLFATE